MTAHQGPVRARPVLLSGESLAAARGAADTAAAYKMETVAASADLAAATVSAVRGHGEALQPLLHRMLATLDLAGYRVFAARARARGLLAEPADAEAHFAPLFRSRR